MLTGLFILELSMIPQFVNTQDHPVQCTSCGVPFAMPCHQCDEGYAVVVATLDLH
jgi:hypothetical protein